MAQRLIASSDDLELIAADDSADDPALHGWRREVLATMPWRSRTAGWPDGGGQGHQDQCSASADGGIARASM